MALKALRRCLCNLICPSHSLSSPISQPSHKILIPVSEYISQAPRSVFNPNNHTRLTTSSPLLPFDATDQEYDSVLRGSDWGSKLINSIPSFDKLAVEGGHYYRIPAKDIVISYYRAPKHFRSFIVDALIANRIIVASVHESSYPKEWDIPRHKKAHVKHFSHPLVAAQHQPFEPDFVYTYTDSSYNKAAQKCGLGYVIFHNQKIIDEGCAAGSEGESSHIGELESINFGIRATHRYLSSLSPEQIIQVKGVILRNDSTSAVGHSHGSSKFDKLNTVTMDTVWDTYRLMDSFDVLIYQYIPRELNVAADMLARYGCDLQLKSTGIPNCQG